MTDKKSNDSRRKLLKSLAVGSGAVVAGKSLPESWSKPVINSIVLPAHAALTDDGSGSSGDGVTTTPEACVIAGTFCYTHSQFTLEITVAADGKVDITYDSNRGIFTNDTGSVPVTGGSFDITLTKGDQNSGTTTTPNPSDIRIVTGDVACNSDAITNVTLKEPGSPRVRGPFSAPKGSCAPR